jgi:catechol 2,3-dioxygenase-like lactoylglutathione lyase family enzyme
MPNVTGVKSIVLTSEHPERLVAFYRDVLELPFEAEDHEDMPRHWACRFTGLHLAIHDWRTFAYASSSAGSDTFLTFAISNREQLVEHLRANHVEVEQTEIGPMKFVTFRDPDGRVVSCGTSWRSGG